MSRQLLRLLQKLLGAVAALLIVPIAVNVGTGGTPPGWLSPFTGLLWPAAVACVIGVVVLELLEQQGGLGEKTISVRHPNDPRNVDRALDQVARYVGLRQRNSLAERVRIALSLDERPAAVRQAAHLVKRVDNARFPVAGFGDIVSVFDELSGSMLILGAAGAGKSTQLLDLAEQLIAQARDVRSSDPTSEPPVPVVVDLAEWVRSGTRRWGRRSGASPRPLANWLLTVLRDRYNIPEPVSRSWLAADRFVLLLDGLDEVRAAERERCVQEINQLERGGITRLVVCSRTNEYAYLRGRLELQGAVEIQPFDREQVTDFLTNVSPQLGGVAAALAVDSELWDMLTTPLMLNIMALAYGDGSGSMPDLPAEGDSANRRRLLFDTYVIEVLARHRNRTWRGSTERLLRALRMLAQISTRLGSGVQVPSSAAAASRMSDEMCRIAVGWTTVVSGTSAAAGVAAGVRMQSGLVAAVLVAFVLWALAAFFNISAQLVGQDTRMTWRRGLLVPLWSVIALTTEYGVIRVGQELVVQVVPGNWSDSSRMTTEGFVIGFLASTAWFAVVLTGLSAGDVGDTSGLPHFGPLLGKIAVGVSLVAVFTLGVRAPGPFWGGFVVSLALLAGIVLGFFPGFLLAILFVLPLTRLALLSSGEPYPWRRALLRFAADRSLLSFVDPEYRFVHLLVRDYLADCSPSFLADAVRFRRESLERQPPDHAALG